MMKKRFAWLLALAVCAAALATPSLAAEVDSDSVYCFSSGDFSEGEDPLVGVCILELPDPDCGTVMLGTRVVQPGDIFTAEQLKSMTFCPLRTQEDGVATVSYMPIYEDRVERTAVMTISIRGKEDKAPVAKDVALETYKNIPNEGKLKVTDPEGQKLVYTVTRQPRRGTVQLRPDGTFTYTPDKNKVGVDSFTYTATDPAGNVSKEATVTVQILKPSQSEHYRDTVGLDCRFEAEWLRDVGAFSGEQVGEQLCFQPEKTVTKGEFLAMLLEVLEAPVEQQSSYTGLAAQAPAWLKPYLAAAMRSGLMTGLTENFDPEAAITGDEAAMLLQNALDLAVTETMAAENSAESVALAVMNSYGFALTDRAPLTRGEVACILYKVSHTNAPGKQLFP